MVVLKVVVPEAAIVGEGGYVVVHLVDGLWNWCGREVVVLLYAHYVGDVVPCEM